MSRVRGQAGDSAGPPPQGAPGSHVLAAPSEGGARPLRHLQEGLPRRVDETWASEGKDEVARRPTVPAPVGAPGRAPGPAKKVRVVVQSRVVTLV